MFRPRLGLETDESETAETAFTRSCRYYVFTTGTFPARARERRGFLSETTTARYIFSERKNEKRKNK